MPSLVALCDDRKSTKRKTRLDKALEDTMLTCADLRTKTVARRRKSIKRSSRKSSSKRSKKRSSRKSSKKRSSRKGSKKRSSRKGSKKRSSRKGSKKRSSRKRSSPTSGARGSPLGAFARPAAATSGPVSGMTTLPASSGSFSSLSAASLVPPFVRDTTTSPTVDRLTADTADFARQHVAKADDEDAAFMRLDAYELLGVPRTATLDQINRAYRAAARRAHPDKNGGKDALFKRIQKAVELLRDSQRSETGKWTLVPKAPPFVAGVQQHTSALAGRLQTSLLDQIQAAQQRLSDGRTRSQRQAVLSQLEQLSAKRDMLAATHSEYGDRVVAAGKQLGAAQAGVNAAQNRLHSAQVDLQQAQRSADALAQRFDADSISYVGRERTLMMRLGDLKRRIQDVGAGSDARDLTQQMLSARAELAALRDDWQARHPVSFARQQEANRMVRDARTRQREAQLRSDASDRDARAAAKAASDHADAHMYALQLAHDQPAPTGVISKIAAFLGLSSAVKVEPVDERVEPRPSAFPRLFNAPAPEEELAQLVKKQDEIREYIDAWMDKNDAHTQPAYGQKGTVVFMDSPYDMSPQLAARFRAMVNDRALQWDRISDRINHLRRVNNIQAPPQHYPDDTDHLRVYTPEEYEAMHPEADEADDSEADEADDSEADMPHLEREDGTRASQFDRVYPVLPPLRPARSPKRDYRVRFDPTV